MSAAVRRGTQTCAAAVVETSNATTAGSSRPGQYLLLAASAISVACYAAYRWGFYNAQQEARRRYDNNNDHSSDDDNDDDDDGDDDEEEEEYEYDE